MRSFALFSGLVLAPLANAVYVPGVTGAPQRFSVGSYTGGQILSLTATGIVDATGLGEYLTYADGSLAQPCTDPLYPYASTGATDYPTAFGGDGVNHLTGGGINFDDNLYKQGYPTDICFAYAGAETTDTTAPGLVRFETLLGTFATNPGRNDWFPIGTSRTITVPSGGGSLYVAINDGSYGNNAGGYTLNVMPVPEPSALLVFGLGAGVVLRRRRFR